MRRRTHRQYRQGAVANHEEREVAVGQQVVHCQHADGNAEVGIHVGHVGRHGLHHSPIHGGCLCTPTRLDAHTHTRVQAQAASTTRRPRHGRKSPQHAPRHCAARAQHSARGRRSLRCAHPRLAKRQQATTTRPATNLSSVVGAQGADHQAPSGRRSRARSAVGYAKMMCASLYARHSTHTATGEMSKRTDTRRSQFAPHDIITNGGRLKM